jgi:protein-tyrosine phosphatase
MSINKKPSILFICTANRFRSPLAEAIFRILLHEQGSEQDWKISSAGSWTEDGLTPLPSLNWSREHLGLDLSEHRSRSVSSELVTQFDLVLVMEQGQKEALLIEFPEMHGKIYMLTEISKGPVFDIPDPILNPDVSCLDVAKEISRLITDNFQDICQRAKASQENQNIK